MRWIFVLILLSFFISAENVYAARKAVKEPDAPSVVQPPMPSPQPPQPAPANPAMPSGTPGMTADSRQAFGQGETPIDLLNRTIPVLKELISKLDARFIEKNQDLINRAQDLIKRGETVIGIFFPGTSSSAPVQSTQ